MLTAGCGSSPEARPTRPASKADGGTTAPSPQPSSTLRGPFGQVRGWIAYSSAVGIWGGGSGPAGAADPAEPRRRRPHRVVERGNEAPHPTRSAEPDGVGCRADGSCRARCGRHRDAPTRCRPTGGWFSPDGSMFVYAAGPFERSAIYAVNSDGGAPRLILRSTRQIVFPGGRSALAFAYHPALSPDGTRIAYFDGMFDHSHSLWVANADGTERRVSLDDELSRAGHVRALTWSPDGEWLAFATDGSIYRVGRTARGSDGWSPETPAPHTCSGRQTVRALPTSARPGPAFPTRER